MTRKTTKTTTGAECHSPDPGPNCSCKNGAQHALFTDASVAMRVVDTSFPWHLVAKHMAYNGHVGITPAIRALKEYLVVVMMTDDGPVAMINAIVDEAWHSAILHTLHYATLHDAIASAAGVEKFFFHHIPGTEEPVTEEMVDRFKRQHSKIFPKSRSWAKCEQIARQMAAA